MQVWQSVIVKTENHPRYGQAGTVFAAENAEFPGEVAVRFDVDSEVQAVLIEDLRTL